MTISTVPFSTELAVELAQREQFLERTRQQRLASAQALIRSAFPLTELRTIGVLYPYTTFEVKTRYRKVMETREVPVRS